MTSRIQKRLLLPNRVRLPPHEGFSWVDRRFLQDYATRLSRDAILLYFFFTENIKGSGLNSMRPDPLLTLYCSPIPDLDRSVVDERHALCFGCPQSIQMHGDDLGHRIWTSERSVDGRFRLLHHVAFVIVNTDCKEPRKTKRRPQRFERLMTPRHEASRDLMKGLSHN